MSDEQAVGAGVEGAVKEASARGDYEAAVTHALEAYGPEVLSFLRSRLRSQSDGDEVFSMFAEDVWKGLPGFSFRCSVRGWLYTVARNAANRYTTSPQNRAARNQPLSQHASLEALVERARTATQIHQRTDVKDRMRALRERLPTEDQTLLILYIDRNLPWRELALVMHDGEQALEGEALERETARLRKRFERVKAELRALAKAEGLIKG